MDALIGIGGMIYGALLVFIFFVKSNLTEKLRLDALIVPSPTSQTRVINLVAGIAFFAYSCYSVLY